LWEYKRKLRKIPKKEREKEKKEGFPKLISTIILSIGKIFRKIPQNILIVVPPLHNTSDGEK